jgi:hypothetical protein
LLSLPSVSIKVTVSRWARRFTVELLDGGRQLRVAPENMRLALVPAGTAIQVDGLASAVEHNGKLGEVLRRCVQPHDPGRYEVRLQGGVTVRLRPVNMRLPPPRAPGEGGGVGGRGTVRARSHCRFVLLLTHSTPNFLTCMVPLFLKRQCARTQGTVQAREQAKALVAAASNDDRAEVRRG